jgi:hypothetical protein
VVYSERVFDGICGGLGYRLDSFGRELRRICRSLRDRNCQPENRQFVWWFGAYGSLPIRLRGTRLIPREEFAQAGWLGP